MKPHYLFVLCSCLCLSAGCDGGSDEDLCGNNVLDAGEQCDGQNFGNLTCSVFNELKPEGGLTCTPECMIDTTSCTEKAEVQGCNHDGKLDPGEDCDGEDFGGKSCGDIDASKTEGSLVCTSECKIDNSKCTEKAKDPVCNHDGKLDPGEDCDGEDFGGKSCGDIDASRPYGRLGCTQSCTISVHYCSASDLGLQAPVPDSESTDAQCSNGLNDFHTINKDGTESKWLDCQNNQCNHSPLVQVCHATENSDATCSDGVDNANGANLHNNFKNKQNGLKDCEDPSCYKNWRVTVCEDQAPKWELGAECADNQDNDGDGLKDCEDPDCLHAGISSCPLNDRVRVLFDNAHHEMAGAVDWIIDITGRHPWPSKPNAETEWHGSLSLFAKDLLDSGHFIVETLPQDRKLTYQDSTSLQDLKDYQILVLPEPSSTITAEESKAIYEFVKNGGGLLMIADHAGADRDGNGVDAVIAFNKMLSTMPGAENNSNPFGFTVLDGKFSSNSTTKVSDGAEQHPVIAGPNGTVKSTGLYGAAEFQIIDSTNVQSLLTEKTSTTPFAVAATVEKGKVVAIGDSAIIGDGTNFLGLKLTTENGYIDANLDNRIFLLNAMEWLKLSNK